LFANNLQQLQRRVDTLAPPAATTLVNMSQVRNQLLGRAFVTRCKCCNQRKVKRANATCQMVAEFESVCAELAKPHSKRSLDKICDPGEGALAFECIRIDGMTASVHLHECGECPSPALRLATLANEMRETTCDRCVLVLSFKAILLLATLEKCDTAPKSSSKPRVAVQQRALLDCTPVTPNVIDFVLKQMPWQQLLHRLKSFTKHT
jgi:hypothetical protein